MIALQKSNGGFYEKWIEYCESKNLPYKIVDVYSTNIIAQLEGCSSLLWQFYQANPTDILMAKALLFSLEQKGINVFPNFRTAWHFDDKIGQKYLLEALDIPFVKTWVFYNKLEAKEWINHVDFPKVLKLRGGAGSQNVELINNKRAASKRIKQAFGRGIKNYKAWASLKERYRLFKKGAAPFSLVFKGIVRFIIPPGYVRHLGREKGYIYFQEFIPGNDHDIRVVVINDKAFAIKRLVRKNDFRASGSGDILYEKKHFSDELIKLSFDISDKLHSQCVAFDFIFLNNDPLIVEISYGFSPKGYEKCPGYWDKSLHWHETEFNPYGWMIENILNTRNE